MSTESTNDKVFVENLNYETGNWKIDIWYEPYANANASQTYQRNKMKVRFKERNYVKNYDISQMNTFNSNIKCHMRKFFFMNRSRTKLKIKNKYNAHYLL